MRKQTMLKKTAKMGLNYVQSIFVVFAQAAGLIDFQVPPNSSMRKTSSRSIRHYYITGMRTYLPIATYALSKGIRLHEKINILDFGCGVGRQLLHFTRHYPHPSYYACDIDDTAVAFMAKSYPTTKAYTNSFTPPLEYESGFFDMVYSVSIFSHLNMEDQKIWLPELARITKPGSYCFLTTLGHTALKSLAASFGKTESELKRSLDHMGYLYREYESWQDHNKNQRTLRLTSHLIGVKHSYGQTVLSPDYITKNWASSDFEVIDIVEGIIDHLQDLVVMRRKKGRMSR